MSLISALLPLREKHFTEARQHRYRAPLRPRQGAIVRWARMRIARPTDFDEVTGDQHPSPEASSGEVIGD